MAERRRTSSASQLDSKELAASGEWIATEAKKSARVSNCIIYCLISWYIHRVLGQLRFNDRFGCKCQCIISRENGETATK